MSEIGYLQLPLLLDVLFESPRPLELDVRFIKLKFIIPFRFVGMNTTIKASDDNIYWIYGSVFVGMIASTLTLIYYYYFFKQERSLLGHVPVSLYCNSTTVSHSCTGTE